MDPDLGLIHVRVPTWIPFRLQFYFHALGQPIVPIEVSLKKTTLSQRSVIGSEPRNSATT